MAQGSDLSEAWVSKTENLNLLRRSNRSGGVRFQAYRKGNVRHAPSLKS